MGDKDIGVLEAIEMAMDAEKKANEFYLNAVGKVSNERGKNLLQRVYAALLVSLFPDSFHTPL